MIHFSTDKQFKLLYEENQKMVRNVLYNMGAKESLDDLVQEAFIRIWKGLPLFSFKSSLKTWIYRITINTVIDHHRKNKLFPVSIPVESNMTQTDESEMVSLTLEDLDEDHRSVVVLFYFEDLSLREISKSLEIPEGTVKSRLSNAKKKMKIFLESKGLSL
jgi:RNA polymerase sigma-70 factor (ECF subfamily)